jgi:hypothetical protein
MPSYISTALPPGRRVALWPVGTWLITPHKFENVLIKKRKKMFTFLKISYSTYI